MTNTLFFCCNNSKKRSSTSGRNVEGIQRLCRGRRRVAWALKLCKHRRRPEWGYLKRILRRGCGRAATPHKHIALSARCPFPLRVEPLSTSTPRSLINSTNQSQLWSRCQWRPSKSHPYQCWGVTCDLLGG